MRLVAFRSLGMSPFYFDELCERGEIKLLDVMDLIHFEMLQVQNADLIVEFVQPGFLERKEQAAADAKTAAFIEWALKEQEW